MQDTTLLDRNMQLTMKGLRDHFHAHDFSAHTSGYKFTTASSEKNQLYLKAKDIFRSFWAQQMKKLCKKGSLKNFSADAPIRCLEESEEKLVAGTVMEILDNEPYAEKLMDQVLTSMQRPMNAEIEKYAASRGKTVQELTEEEFQQAVDAFADEFLSRMMKLLLQTQDVPTLYKYLSKNGAHEDFDENVQRNYNKMNFYRKWDHLHSKTVKMIPLTKELMDTIPANSAQIAIQGADLGMQPVSSSEELYHQILNAFIDSLDNDIDRQIMYMRTDGKTQSEIAAALKYANHSPVTKRLQRLKKQFQAFKKANGI